MPSASPRPPNPNPRAPVRLRARRAFPADRRVAVGTAAADGAALMAKAALQEGTKKDLVSVAQYYSSKLVSYVRKVSAPPPVNSLWLVPSCRRAALARCDRADP